MQFRAPTTAAVRALLIAASICAAEHPSVDAQESASGSHSCSGHWRPVRKTNSKDLRARAQSPDDELAPRSGPVWSYPSRRQPTSVPVPPFEGEVHATWRRAEPDRVALAPPERRAAPRTDPVLDASFGASFQNDAPQERPSIHSSPFERSVPSHPVDPVPSCPIDPACSPCRRDPFDDACAPLINGYSNYSSDNGYLFALGEAFRLTDENTRAGGRFGLNWGLPIIDDDAGLGFQVGFSGSALEEGPQVFVTSGVFYRGDMRLDAAWNMGAVFDWMQDDEFDADYGQVRAQTSITLDRKNEIGVWGAMSVLDHEDRRGRTSETVDQLNLFYRYLFDTGWDVTGWGGWRTDPNSAALGITTYLPINDQWAGVFGAYYAFDADSWNIYGGLVWHWFDRARQDYIGQDRHQPYIPVADNATMTLSVGR